MIKINYSYGRLSGTKNPYKLFEFESMPYFTLIARSSSLIFQLARSGVVVLHDGG